MQAFFYKHSRFKAKNKTKKRQKKKVDWLAAALLFFAVLSFYCVVFPESAGLWGRRLARFLSWLSGTARYILPVWLGWFAGHALIRSEKRPNLIRLSTSLGFIVSLCLALTLVGTAVWNENYGGVIGLAGIEFLSRLFGTVGSWIVTIGFATTLGFLFAGISPGEATRRLFHVLRADWQDWKRARLAVKKKEPRAPIVPPAEALKAALPPPAPTTLPKIVGIIEKVKEKIALPAEPAATKPPPKVVTQPTPKPADRKQAAETPPLDANGASAAARPKTPYHRPSLEIFEAFGGGSPVPQQELTERAGLLEKTLANFNIEARVVEIHPGPVITRYDLEPAPGVKVASISSRQDDIALAMRSTGIRVLAPIPGKGAVGIEIPNSNPEIVGLQALLAKPEFLNHQSPIVFALGKTVSGEPYYVDLAAMPHMLVAGATGAGKSVVIHSIISSILYRMPPDRVKFTLIDPKRLELPSYTLIPHLYDPCHGPAQAEVITNSKQAAKALSRLVKVMEYRYDQFAKANVRNIDSYNRKRQDAGLPPECYIVVIIDELADLMLTSPKEVEDSIQRLAQMARAVGIHLILATQRPSVNVITGVIKANLPARIALRVASGTDSRVIIDSTGAESLLGKGDMLFLPPASVEPVRIQGAFVTEPEVEKLVEHVKQFGLPNYDDLFSSGSALEFAVEDKKEMRDLIEALKLILERHRVSQDLLKAHFGSSARATNILSLLEVKAFIRKPEGSNRWEINYDLVEEMLEKVSTIPDEELG